MNNILTKLNELVETISIHPRPGKEDEDAHWVRGNIKIHRALKDIIREERHRQTKQASAIIAKAIEDNGLLTKINGRLEMRGLGPNCLSTQRDD